MTTKQRIARAMAIAGKSLIWLVCLTMAALMGRLAWEDPRGFVWFLGVIFGAIIASGIIIAVMAGIATLYDWLSEGDE